MENEFEKQLDELCKKFEQLIDVATIHTILVNAEGEYWNKYIESLPER